MHVPEAVREAAGGEPLELVWHNDLGGLTYRMGTGRFLKWAPPGEPELDIPGEVRRLRWAGHHTAVPHVLQHGSTVDGSWMITAALPGDNAISPRWKADPATAVRAIGAGLRAMHDSLPVLGCPFSWSVQARLESMPDLPAETRSALADAPEIDRLVVCHGDACAPNTLLDDSGQWCAHVDLGQLGTADRWADIAIATWSTEWNYGPGWEAALLEAYGTDPDPVRTAYYRRLWDPLHA